MTTWKLAAERVEMFRRFLAPGTPSFEIEHAMDVSTWETDLEWREKEGKLGRCGVYFVYDENDCLLKVGQTTNSTKLRLTNAVKVPGSYAVAFILMPAGYGFLAALP